MDSGQHAYGSPDEDESAYSQDSYSPDGRYSSDQYSPGQSTAHGTDARYFPETNYFPPPPTAPAGHVDGNLPNAPYPPYNPADYPPHNDYGPPSPPGGYVHDGDMNPGNPYARQDQNHYYQARRGDENVSAPAPNSGAEHVTPASTRGGSRPTYATDDRTDRASGVNPTRDESPPLAPSPVSTREKGVKFDLNPQEQEISPNPSPERSDENRDRHRERRDDSDSDDERHGSERDRTRDRDHHRRRHADERSNGSQGSGRDRKRHRRAESSGSDTDSTVELPPRFDEKGRRRGDDPAADKLESVLQSLFR